MIVLPFLFLNKLVEVTLATSKNDRLISVLNLKLYKKSKDYYFLLEIYCSFLYRKLWSVNIFL